MVWDQKTNLKGPRGPQGDRGPQGVPGTPPPYAAYSLAYSKTLPVNAAAKVTPTSSGSVTFGTPSKFGLAFAGGRIVLPVVPALRLSGKSFTMELVFNIATAPFAKRAIFAIGGDNIYLFVDPTGKLGWNTQGLTSALSPASVCDSQNHHVAVQFTESTGGTFTADSVYLDGVAMSGLPMASGIGHVSSITVGGLTTATGYDFPGRIDEVRFSNGYRYTGTFTPPTAPFTWDDSSLDIAHLEDANVQIGIGAYPTRPATADSGAVTYVGPTQPTDAKTLDRWVRTAP